MYQSVEVCEENAEGSIVKKIFKEYPPITFKQGIMFYPWEDEKDSVVETGVLYSKDGSLEIGIPAKRWEIVSLLLKPVHAPNCTRNCQ